MDLEFQEVVDAYFQCRKGKRRSIHALDFEFDLEQNLSKLYEDLVTGRYQISTSIAFVVDQPKIVRFHRFDHPNFTKFDHPLR